jgi:dihydropteroate synthase
LISQVINLSKSKSFKLYKEKYKLSINHSKGLFGIEIRQIPKELLNAANNINSDYIFQSDQSLFLVGSVKDLENTASEISINDNIKSEIFSALKRFENSESISYTIGDYNFDFKNAYVMGILNVTPDSFSDGGKYSDKASAVKYAIEMIEMGADIIDIGGESSRPGSDPVSESEELKRVIPVINEILNKNPRTILSIDTTKSKVAEEALKHGAKMVNDISGGTFEQDIFNVITEYDAAMVIMHIKDKPKTMQVSPKYSEVVSEVYDYLVRQSNIATAIGVKKIIVDPGIGFGKRVEDNLELIDRLEDFKSMGFPILIGLSRKSFIGNILNLPVEDRDDVTNSLNSFALSNGARIIRTHNTKQAVENCKIFNRIINN